MNIIKLLLISSVFFIVIPSTTSAFIFDKYHVKVRVVDDSGQSVGNANAGIAFESISGKVATNRGVSDSNGYFEASSNGNGYIMYGATKDGYYLSQYSCNLTFEGQCKVTDGELKILLRKIVNPVPMFARDTVKSIIEIPVVDKDVGFDLTKFDWVVPYGKGLESDFVFHLERLPIVTRQSYSASLSLKFTNRFDGIQKYFESLGDGSQFKLLRYAPESGYEPGLELQESFTTYGTDKLNFDFREKNLNYIFRIRSVEKDGKLKKAMYGKIRGNIDFTAIGSKTAKIYFNYYLNPDFTNNLEFDPKQNLFLNLPKLERVPFP